MSTAPTWYEPGCPRPPASRVYGDTRSPHYLIEAPELETRRAYWDYQQAPHESRNDDAPVAAEASKGHSTENGEIIGVVASMGNSGASHVEAKRLHELGFKLCKLEPMRKKPVGNGWQLNPVPKVDDHAGGYGLMLAANGLCSIDPDNVEPARQGLLRCGFNLDDLMAAGVRTTSTRPGSGGRSTFKAPEGLGRVVFASTTHGTILELRAGQSNLQDCLPGTVYLSQDDKKQFTKGPYHQRYANGKTLEMAPDLPVGLSAWWQRMDNDLEFKREQQVLFCGTDAVQAISGKGSKLAFTSPMRMDFNAQADLVELLERHAYTTEDDQRWAPHTASGTPCVRPIPGKEGLWHSDHASDPLHGTFDAWTAYVVLDHGGDLAAAEKAYAPVQQAKTLNDFEDVSGQAEQAGKALRHPQVLDWSSLPEDPPEPAFVIPGWMPDGVVTLFAAHGGTGKSFMSVYIALCLATGRHPFNSGEQIPRVKVVLYSAEDNMLVMHSRFARYMRLMGIAAGDLVGWLLVLDATESDNVLFVGDQTTNGRTTARFTWLERQVADFAGEVLIFDNASDAMDANENDRAKVRQFMSTLKRLARAVLLLAHVDAMSSMAEPGEAKGYSGSTGWHNSARSRWFMSKEKDSEYIVLTLPKVNYAKAGGEVVIQWSDQHKVFEIISTRDSKADVAYHRGALLELFRLATEVLNQNISPAVNTSSSVFNTIKHMDGFPRGLKSAGMAREVSRWLGKGLVEIAGYTRPNRTQGSRLVLTDAGRELCEGDEIRDNLK